MGSLLVQFLSASGNSPNVLAAAELARLAGATVIALTGHSGGRLRRLAHVTVRVAADPIEQVEAAHLAIAHSLCVALRQRLHTLRFDAAVERSHVTEQALLAAPVTELMMVDRKYDTPYDTSAATS